MKRILLFVAGIAIAASSGCASCCGPYDYDYPTFGGKWERIDRQSGRVASAFYDASQQLAPIDGEAPVGEPMGEQVEMMESDMQ